MNTDNPGDKKSTRPKDSITWRKGGGYGEYSTLPRKWLEAAAAKARTDAIDEQNSLPKQEIKYVKARELNITARFANILDRDPALVAEIKKTAMVEGRLSLEHAVALWDGEVVDGSSRSIGACLAGEDTWVPTYKIPAQNYEEARAWAITTTTKRRQMNNRVHLIYVARHADELEPGLLERVLDCADSLSAIKVDPATVHACTAPGEYFHPMTREAMKEEIGLSLRIIYYILVIIRHAELKELREAMSGKRAFATLGRAIAERGSLPKEPVVPRLLQAMSPKRQFQFLELAKKRKVEPKELAMQLVVDGLFEEFGAEDNESIDPPSTSGGPPPQPQAKSPAASIEPSCKPPSKAKPAVRRASKKKTVGSKGPRQFKGRSAWTDEKDAIVIESRLVGDDLAQTAKLIGTDSNGQKMTAEKIRSHLFHLGLGQGKTMKKSEHKKAQKMLAKLLQGTRNGR